MVCDPPISALRLRRQHQSGSRKICKQEVCKHMALRVVDYHARIPVINYPWMSGDFFKRPSSAPTLQQIPEKGLKYKVRLKRINSYELFL